MRRRQEKEGQGIQHGDVGRLASDEVTSRKNVMRRQRSAEPGEFENRRETGNSLHSNLILIFLKFTP